MLSVTLQAHIGADETLTLKIPREFKDKDVEVVVTVKPAEDDLEAIAQANGWPPGFFTQTAGRWEGEPLQREPFGEDSPRYELR